MRRGKVKLLILSFFIVSMSCSANADDGGPVIVPGDNRPNCGSELSEKRIHSLQCLPTNTRDGTALFQCWKYADDTTGQWQCTEKCEFQRCCRPGATC